LEALEAKLAELEEEHGGEDGAFSSVGSKADAQAARHDALLAAWQSTDGETFQQYQQAVTRESEAQRRLMELNAGPRLSALANAKGKLTQKILMARGKATDDPDELTLLAQHKTAVATLKGARKVAAELLKAATINIRKRLQDQPDHEEFIDLRLIALYLELTEQIIDEKTALKKAEADLDAKAYASYPKFSQAEVQTLVVDDKWLAVLDAAIHGEMDRISQALTQRVRELAERYETPMPQMVNRVAELDARVSGHLGKMGFSWN
jgi:type I restriction enzyme M protein